MVPSIYAWKPYKDVKLKALALWLRARRVNADLVTLAGLLLGLTAAGWILARHNWLGVCFLGLSIGADLLDGTLARLEKTPTRFGQVWDSLCDRLVEAAWVGALVSTGRLNPWALLLVVASLLLMFCRFWANRRQLDSSFVFVTRFERMTALLGVMIIPWPKVAMLLYTLVTVGTVISCLQIIRVLLGSNPVPGNLK